MTMHWLNITKIIDVTEAEGPGLRTAIWTQGCLKRCRGCCNADFLKIKDNSHNSPSHFWAKIAMQ